MDFYKVDKQAMERLYQEIEKVACMVFLDELIKRISKTLIDSKTDK